MQKVTLYIRASCQGPGGVAVYSEDLRTSFNYQIANTREVMSLVDKAVVQARKKAVDKIK